MNHAGNDSFLADYDAGLADLAERAESLRKLAAALTVDPGTIAAMNLASARVDLRLAIRTIAQAREISGAVCIPLTAMSERLDRIEVMLDDESYVGRTGAHEGPFLINRCEALEAQSLPSLLH